MTIGVNGALPASENFNTEAGRQAAPGSERHGPTPGDVRLKFFYVSNGNYPWNYLLTKQKFIVTEGSA